MGAKATETNAKPVKKPTPKVATDPNYEVETSCTLDTSKQLNCHCPRITKQTPNSPICICLKIFLMAKNRLKNCVFLLKLT